MRLSWLLLFFLCLGTQAWAQDCDCIKMEVTTHHQEQQVHQLTVRVKNNCYKRFWFYTDGFWLSHVDKTTNVETSLTKKLRNGKLPAFIRLGWKEEQDLTFVVDIAQFNSANARLSYSNTEHKYPARFLGPPTYLCEKKVKIE